MKKTAPDRKKEILAAALPEFITEGMTGARLQTIANQIDVTKAMIHYYFDSKEKLFEAAFVQACETLMTDLWEPLEGDTSLFQKIEGFIDRCMGRLSQNSALSYFIIGELNKHPDITRPLFQQSIHFDVTRLEQQLNEAASNYEIAQVDSDQLLTTILSLCFFPYSGQTFLQEALDRGEENYQEFLTQRQDIIKDTIINWLVG